MLTHCTPTQDRVLHSSHYHHTQNFRYTLNLLMWEPKNPNWSSKSSKCAPKKYMRFLLRPITSFNTNHLYSSVTAKRLYFRLYHASNNGLESKHSYPQSPLQIKEIHLHLLPCPKCPLTESNTTKLCRLTCPCSLLEIR